jgi:hypothetical protein
MWHRVSVYSPRKRQDSEQKPISGAQRRRRHCGMTAGDVRAV